MIAPPISYNSNRYNAAPRIYQFSNTSDTSVTIGWANYNPILSDAIGTNLYLNGIEILHSTYEIPYGSPNLTQSAIGNEYSSSNLVEVTRIVLKEDENGENVLSSELSSYSPHRRRSSHPPRLLPFKSPKLSVRMPREIPILTLPMGQRRKNYDDDDVEHPILERIGETISFEAYPEFKSTRGHIEQQSMSRRFNLLPIESSHHLTPIGSYDHPSSSPTSSTSSSSPLLLDALVSSDSELMFDAAHDIDSTSGVVVEGESGDGVTLSTYYIFTLKNLLPSTEYVVSAGYLLPNGYYSIGQSIVIKMKPKKV